MRILFSLSIMVLFLGACTSEAPRKQTAALQYFDLKGYMHTESLRLTKLHPQIRKTVMVNNAAEQKNMQISDWQKELSAFSDADINKLAWQGLFKRVKEKDTDSYVSADDKVPVKSLTIAYKNQKVTGIRILISNTNSLYTSHDTLSYYPDSLYQVKKTQHIRLLKEKNYHITGTFK